MALVILAFALLTLLFTRRADRLEAEMERVGFDLMVRNLHTELMMYQTTQIIAGQYQVLAQSAGQNPVGRVFGTPPSYAGELDGDRPERVSPGQWYFDRKDGLLVYRVSSADFFRSPLAGPARARFRLELKYEDKNGDNRYESGVDAFQGLSFTPAERYEWLQFAKD